MDALATMFGTKFAAPAPARFGVGQGAPELELLIDVSRPRPDTSARDDRADAIAVALNDLAVLRARLARLQDLDAAASRRGADAESKRRWAEGQQREAEGKQRWADADSERKDFSSAQRDYARKWAEYWAKQAADRKKWAEYWAAIRDIAKEEIRDRLPEEKRLAAGIDAIIKRLRRMGVDPRLLGAEPARTPSPGLVTTVASIAASGQARGAELTAEEARRRTKKQREVDKQAFAEQEARAKEQARVLRESKEREAQEREKEAELDRLAAEALKESEAAFTAAEIRRAAEPADREARDRKPVVTAPPQAGAPFVPTNLRPPTPQPQAPPPAGRLTPAQLQAAADAIRPGMERLQQSMQVLAGLQDRRKDDAPFQNLANGIANAGSKAVSVLIRDLGDGEMTPAQAGAAMNDIAQQVEAAIADAIKTL